MHANKEITALVAALEDTVRALRCLQPTPRASKKLSFCQRLTKGNLTKFWKGDSVRVQDSDAVVNTMALVAALLLTIPFSLVGSLNTSYWDEVLANLQACPDHLILPFTPAEAFSFLHALLVNPLCAIVYLAMGSILTAVFYYVLRPGEDLEFREWWSRGRWGLGLIFACTIAGVVCAFILFNVLVPARTLVGSSADLCASLSPGRPYGPLATAEGGMAAVLALVFFAALIMV